MTYTGYTLADSAGVVKPTLLELINDTDGTAVPLM